jgi:hypothetical protein
MKGSVGTLHPLLFVFFFLHEIKRCSSLVSIVTSYRLDDHGSGVQFPMGAGNFSLLHHVHTVSGAHPASYPMSTGGSFSRGKATGA